MKIEYAIKEGRYFLQIEGIEKVVGEQVAIAFDLDTWVVLKHGAPSLVVDWVRDAKRQFLKVGNLYNAAQLTVISGAIPVEELNKIVSTSGYLEHFLGRDEVLV
jgi:hypothetical protein